MATLSARSSPAAHRIRRRAVAVLERLARVFTSNRAVALALAIPMAVALLAPLGPLAANRFHRDEAIYSSWGLDIASGRDLLVSGSPVDKPPLFLYVQALSFILFGPTEVAARLPSLVASVASVALTYALGQWLYGRGAGLLAAFLLAASPFAILFAPTAFTDPMMVTWVLAGCLAAARGRWVWAGIALGLATITKQQGIFFVPLAVGLGHISNPKSQISNLKSFTVTFLAVAGLAIGWDVARARHPGFLAQSLASYGGLPLEPTAIWERLIGFWDLLRYGTGSPVLNGILLAGLPLLLAVDILTMLTPTPALPLSGGGSTLPSPFRGKGMEKRVSPTSNVSPAQADLALLAFAALFLIGHSAVAFQVWDRYLLGLIPLLALLLARVLTLPWRLFQARASRVSHSIAPIPTLLYLLLIMSILIFTMRPIQDAATSRFPIGGDHGAYQGIEQVVDYFKTIPADTTLYHRWLGWHWRFYLWGSPYDFRAWTSAADLADQAAARRGARRYVVFPSWCSSTEARLALAGAGLTLCEVQRAFRDDGSVSFIVYRIEEAQ